MSQQLWWYTARASGLVAWVLVTAAVVWGLLLSFRRLSRPRPAWMLDLHRFLGGMTVLLLALHLVSLSFDSFVGFDWDDLFIPYASVWRPGAVALGIVGLYLLLAVEITSLLMRHLGRGLWHAIHLLSFAVFVAITLHALYAGADAREPMVLGFAICASATVAALCVARVLLRRPRRGQPLPLTSVRPAPADGVRSERQRVDASGLRR